MHCDTGAAWESGQRDLSSIGHPFNVVPIQDLPSECSAVYSTNPSVFMMHHRVYAILLSGELVLASSLGLYSLSRERK